MVSFSAESSLPIWLSVHLTRFFFCGIDKDRKLAEVTAERKALKLNERLREKAVEEVSYISLLLETSFWTFAEACNSLYGFCWLTVCVTGRSYVALRFLVMTFVIIVAVSHLVASSPREFKHVGRETGGPHL
jgi:hypothetical protein